MAGDNPRRSQKLADRPVVMILGVFATLIAVITGILSLADRAEEERVPVFRGDVGHPNIGGGDEFAEFLSENEDRVVYLDLEVSTELLTSENANPGTATVYGFEVSGTPAGFWSMFIEMRVDSRADFYAGEQHNGLTNIKGHFKVMGNAGLGTGLSVTTLRAVSASEANVLASER